MSSKIPNEREQSAAACGHLKVISDDWTRWHFQSSSNPNIHHTVELTEWDGSGECSCEHFQMRIRPLLTRRIIKPHCSQSKCKHIRRADQVLLYHLKKRLFPAKT
jgi:hypothetical protein